MLLYALVAVGCVLAQQTEFSERFGADLVWSPNLRNAVPKEVFDFLEEANWGDHHVQWHVARKFHLSGPREREWLESENIFVPRIEQQEGSVENGVDFLAMHRSMIQQLTELFGDVVRGSNSSYIFNSLILSFRL